MTSYLTRLQKPRSRAAVQIAAFVVAGGAFASAFSSSTAARVVGTGVLAALGFVAVKLALVAAVRGSGESAAGSSGREVRELAHLTERLAVEVEALSVRLDRATADVDSLALLSKTEATIDRRAEHSIAVMADLRFELAHVRERVEDLERRIGS